MPTTGTGSAQDPYQIATLRSAIEQTNTNPGPDTITFVPSLSGQTILLGMIELDVTDSLSIDAASLAENVVIDANHQSRVLNFSVSTGDLTLSNLALKNGTTSGYGGAILFGSTGTLTISSSSLVGSSATYGGGLFNHGIATITGSTISGNTATLGAGLFNDATATIANSTLSGNSASFYGGGIGNTGTVTITSSTLSANSGDVGGGGIKNFGIVTVTNSIVANSSSGGDVANSGTLNGAHNLVEDGSDGLADTITGDPLLGPLADNGGPTMTHAVLLGSPALDAGDPALDPNSFDPPLVNDQRGPGFSRVESGRVDIGAFELSLAIPSQGLVVDTTDDVFNGNYAVGDLSLREAVALANANAGADTITFDAALAGQTILLDGTELNATESLTIDASPLAQNVTIDANHLSRVLNFSTSTGDLALLALTLRNGQTAGDGGGVRFNSDDSLSITSSTISDNSASGRGGGISNEGTATITASTISGNSSANRGGGFFTDYGSSATIADSTISGNSALSPGGSGGGGGVWNSSSIKITNSTISGNMAGGGGGIFNVGTATIANSTISGNSAAPNAPLAGGIINQNMMTLNDTIVANSSSGGDIGNSGTLNGAHNLVEDGSDGLADTITGDPLLGPLVDNGGPTLTHALLPGSPAIDAGDPSFTPPPDYDQRGAGFPRVESGRVDIGAFELDLAIPARGLVVDITNDVFNGDYTEGDLSLREAVALANVNAGADTITFDAALAGQTFLLDGQELGVTESLTIDASALAQKVIIDANHMSRVLNFSASSGDSILAGLQLLNGSTSGSGGAILNAGTLLLDGVGVADSFAAGNGGGIYSTRELTVRNSRIDGNQAGNGGGIETTSGSKLTVDRSTISGNTATSGQGGGIRNSNGTITIVGSTVLGNAAGTGGGGGVFSSRTLTIDDSTISGNTSTGRGGGVNIGIAGSHTITNSTIAENYSAISGGGIESGYADLTITNSIVAKNNVGSVLGAHFGPDAHRFTQYSLPPTSSYTIMGNNLADGFVGFLDPGNGNKLTVDPLLGPLADNGGPTLTYALLPGSPAIDSGDPNFTSPPDFDQRGEPFVRVFDGDGASGARIDVGAFEVQPLVLALVVDSAADESDGDFSVGDLSLREAIERANAHVGADTITFAPALSGQTILLGGTELDVTDSVSIDASSLADKLIVDGDGSSRILSVSAGATVEISGLTLTNASSGSSGGGAIRNEGNLTLRDVVVAHSSAGIGGGIYSNTTGALTLDTVDVTANSANGGGGIYLSQGAANIVNSTTSDNTSTSSGGGILVALGVQLTADNSTISGNHSDTAGGGIYFDSGTTAVLNYITVTDNYANDSENVNGTTDGGGFWKSGSANVTLYNTIVWANYSDLAPNDIQGSLTTGSSYNLIGVGSNLIDGQNGNQVGVADALLGPLTKNGGPTQTHALLPGSPAIDAGDPNAVPGVGTVPLFDQRGSPYTRVFDGDGAAGARIDIGAVEFISEGAIHTLFGDYNRNSVVDAADYTVWRDALGQTGLAPYSGADGSGNGIVDADDYAVWKMDFGATLLPPSAGNAAAALVSTNPLIEIGEATVTAHAKSNAAPIATQLDASRGVGFVVLAARYAQPDSAFQPSERSNTRQVSDSDGDQTLLLLAIDRIGRSTRHDISLFDDRAGEDRPDVGVDSQGLTDEPLAMALAEWC